MELARELLCVGGMQYVHLSVHALRGSPSLVDPRVAPWLWQRLRRGFPDALAACLMPDHPHLLVPGSDVALARRRLGHVLSGLRRSDHIGAAIRWGPASAEGPIGALVKVARQVRYIALNPSRAGLVSDPLSWLWTTHRDVMGALSEPWVSAARLADALDRPLAGFRTWHYAYVSGDPSTDVAGTPAPAPALISPVSLHPLGDVIAAALAATRTTPEALLATGTARTVLFELAASQEWRDAKLLARLCGTSERTAYRHLARASQPPSAALLCPGDVRLRAPVASAIPAFVSRMLTSKVG